MQEITLSTEQRDALYDLILDRLSGIGDLRLLIEREEFDAADRLGREISDDLRLILDDLGWGDATRPATLTLPPADLRRIFGVLREHAVNGRTAHEQEFVEGGQFLERADLVAAACDQVLTAISGGS